MNPPPFNSGTPKADAAQVAVYESAAKSLAASVFRMTSPIDSEYTLRDVGYFKQSDLAFYQRVSTELQACGLRQIIDVESLSHTRSSGKPVLLRFMLSAEDAFTVVAFNLHPKPPGVVMKWLGRLSGNSIVPRYGTIAFETEFSNGEFVSTDNSLGKNPFGRPPQIHALQMPQDTPPRDLLEEHRRRVAEYENSHAGASVVNVSDLNDIAMREGRQKVLKARYRRSIGGISREELQSLTKERFPHMEETVMKEMRRLLAEQADSSQASSPEWAGFFKPGNYQRFIDIVRADYARRGLQVTIHEGVVRVEGMQIEQGLQNLAQICHQSGEVTLWPGLVSDHFSKLARLLAASGGIEMSPKDFAAASPSLAVKLYPDDCAYGMRNDPPVMRVDLEGTLSVLVLDLADGLRMVNRSMIAGWGKTEAELFELGLQWLQRDAGIEIGDFELVPGIVIKLVASDGFYAASRALILERHSGFVGTHGSLIGVPHRHGLIVYPIETRAVVDAMEALVPMLGGLYKEGPGSISPDMYWYHDGKFTRLPFRGDGNKLVFDPPADFAALLERLR
ncbi:MAG: hypothetical protein ABIS50_12505 [Luteolibacter sp.]|uniref:hypothetical protein n=1 Tax=Luteolibacter sp. TaxID=1962973 RepID=UPI003263CAAA